MIKNKKYRILGVTCVLLLVLSIGIAFPTYAKKPKKGEIIESELTCTELSEKYGLYITQGTGDKEFILIQDDSYAESCADNEGPKPDLKLISINGVQQAGNQVLNSKNKKIKFEAEYLKDEGYEYVNVTLETMDEAKTQVEVSFGATDEQAFTGNLDREPNTHYNGICASFRAEVAGMAGDAQSFYKDAVAYCYRAEVPKGTNYTAAEINSKISGAKASWASFNAETITQTPSFTANFNSIKANAAKVAGHTITIGKQKPSFSLKCRYDYLKKAGASYTNDYGETINSDNDYYLNKDYYFATETTYSGSEWRYTYNYAPGKEVEKPLNGGNPTCERICEEAVRVEYGPPVASKAGLCFEYKVKVTSYVKCTTKFTANPPQEDTGYCNPPPRCVSTKGVERKKPQAGPSQEFDSCIVECDGGKYTPACSKKCYTKVYGNKKGAKKLAVDYETKVATQLTNGEYSLSECLADNSSYYGCYYYSGGEIRWARAGSYHQYSIDSLGRWYIEKHNAGQYNLSGLGSRKYEADSEGFYRAMYANGPCTDICNWKNDCGDRYLNPGTAAKDYKANEKVYEDARRQCASGVTCSSRTTDLTISINYDTVDESGRVTKTTVKFPYDTKKDTIVSKGKGNENTGDTFNNSYTTLLDRDGCYKESDQKNWYLAEWSFPGTYIHNKTGEISFKVPDDTSGWYYEDKKFCMPLNALSVNSKWWEWNVISGADFSKSCYTRDQIEAELGTNDGTSNGYNIKATAKNFGYFGWDFNIGCFYGLRNEICNIDEANVNKKCCKPPVNPPCKNPPCEQTTGVDDYVVRVVNREELFPNKKVPGSITQNTRPIGFNWTEDAKILELKNPDYHVDPIKLIQDIESTANVLHSNDDAYLDYQFYLTPTTLRKIREYNDRYSYGTWNGKVVSKNGVNVYLSNLWNSSEGSIEKNIDLTAITGAVLKTGTPGVNNE